MTEQEIQVGDTVVLRGFSPNRKYTVLALYERWAWIEKIDKLDNPGHFVRLVTSLRKVREVKRRWINVTTKDARHFWDSISAWESATALGDRYQYTIYMDESQQSHIFNIRDIAEREKWADI